MTSPRPQRPIDDMLREFADAPVPVPTEVAQTAAERSAVRRLEALASVWPPSLSLFSASGSLVIYRTEHAPLGRGTEIVAIDGIPNDGGDPW